jgi:cobalt/nickel transport system permease protein
VHIPDGFLNAATLAGSGVIAAGGVANAVRVAGAKIGEKQIPLMGIMAAFIFAAQMLNFPVAGGTSGHLMGAALCAILLGPWSAVIIMTLVLAAQALIFQDGGLLALGANILNMGIIGGLGSFLAFRLLSGISSGNRFLNLTATFVAAWLSVVLAAAACALELAMSGTSPLGVVLPAMTAVHALIGIGEGLVTLAVLSLIRVSRPDLLVLHKV